MSQELTPLARLQAHAEALRADRTDRERRVLRILDARRDRDLVARRPHLGRLAPAALAWAQQTLAAQLQLPASARHGELIDFLTSALADHHRGGRSAA